MKQKISILGKSRNAKAKQKQHSLQILVFLECQKLNVC